MISTVAMIALNVALLVIVTYLSLTRGWSPPGISSQAFVTWGIVCGLLTPQPVCFVLLAAVIVVGSVRLVSGVRDMRRAKRELASIRARIEALMELRRLLDERAAAINGERNPRA